MEYSVQTEPSSRSRLGTTLLILNWGAFAFVGVCALSWLAVSLMVIPYPDLMANAGEDLSAVFTNTAVFAALSVITGAALWLLTRQHALQWYGQAVLAVSLAVAVFWALWMI